MIKDSLISYYKVNNKNNKSRMGFFKKIMNNLKKQKKGEADHHTPK